MGGDEFTILLIQLNYDEKITIREAELFRAMAEALNCPVAPLWLTVHSDAPEP